MNISDYLKDKILFIILVVIQLALITAVFLILKLGTAALIFSDSAIIICSAIFLTIDFKRRKDFYDSFLKSINSAGKPHEAVHTIRRPDFYEGDALCITAEYMKEARDKELSELKNTYIPFISAFEREYQADDNTDKRSILIEQFGIFSESISRESENGIYNVKELLSIALKSKRESLMAAKNGISIKNIRHCIITDGQIFIKILILLLMHTYEKEKSSVKFYCETAPEACLTAEFSTMLEDRIPIEFLLAETLCSMSGIRFKIYQTDHTFVRLFYTLTDFKSTSSSEMSDTNTIVINKL